MTIKMELTQEEVKAIEKMRAKNALPEIDKILKSYPSVEDVKHMLGIKQNQKAIANDKSFLNIVTCNGLIYDGFNADVCIAGYDKRYKFSVDEIEYAIKGKLFGALTEAKAWLYAYKGKVIKVDIYGANCKTINNKNSKYAYEPDVIEQIEVNFINEMHRQIEIADNYINDLTARLKTFKDAKRKEEVMLKAHDEWSAKHH